MPHLRFRMRTIFFVVVLSAIVNAVSLTRAQRQRAAVAEIERLGGRVLYEAAAYDAEPLRLRSWLTSTLGPDWFHSVDGVHLPRATDDSIALLQALSETRKLHLHNSALTRRGMMHVTSLPKLELLQFDRGRLTDACLRSLTMLKRLKHLEVRGTAITDASMPVISQVPAIRSIVLSNCNITDQGLEALRDSKIARLRLSGLRLTERSVSAFSTMTHLEELCLERVSLNDKGLQRLASLGSLMSVTLQMTPVEPGEVTAGNVAVK